MVHPVYPGSFDPPSKGHLDLCERALALFGRLSVAVGVNSVKPPIFSVPERIELISRCLGERPGLIVCSYSGLLVNFCRKNGLDLIIRGLRTAADFDFEYGMAATNRCISGGLETLFLPAAVDQGFTSSTLIKEILQGGGDASPFLHPVVIEKMKEKLESS